MLLWFCFYINLLVEVHKTFLNEWAPIECVTCFEVMGSFLLASCYLGGNWVYISSELIILTIHSIAKCIHQVGHAGGVMVIGLEQENCSNSGQACYIHFFPNILWKGRSPSFLP